ncbi:MAG: tetratricopeptide repeat protein [Candidatus Xenobia bacterium]
MQVSLRTSLAEMQFRTGQPEKAWETLSEAIRRWPGNAWSYIALADAHAHFFRVPTGSPANWPRAMQILHDAMPLVRREQRTDLEERLQAYREECGAG